MPLIKYTYSNIFLFLTFAGFFGFSFAGCKSSSPLAGESETNLTYSLRKGVCFGKCPEFELKVYKNGYATFLGEQNVSNIGLYEKKVSKSNMKELKKAFKGLDFDTYPDNFESRIPDLPLIKIGYNDGKKFRVVAGKEDRPEALMQAQFVLEKIAESDGWTLVKGLNEIETKGKPEVFIYNEVIIEPVKGVLLAKWIESKSKYRVRLVKKIAPALDLYLIEYDTKRIQPKDFMALLKKDKDIKEAEFNKKTTKRTR